MSKNKVFLIFNTSHMGDCLLCNSLCQNIKRIYPESKIVFIVNKPFLEAAKYQRDVDEVICFDKYGEHKSLFSRIKFLIKFPYKSPYCSFVTYRDTTNSIFAYFLFSKKVVRTTLKHLNEKTQLYVTKLLKKITDKPVYNVPISFNPPVCKDFDYIPKDTIAFCPVSASEKKNIPVEKCEEIIKILKNNNYNVVYIGKGELSQKYTDTLESKGLDFINLNNKTTICEMAYVIKNCKGLISCDTGAVHIACAVKTPVVVKFYIKDTAKLWAPDGDLYKSSFLEGDESSQDICDSLFKILNK